MCLARLRLAVPGCAWLCLAVPGAVPRAVPGCALLSHGRNGDEVPRGLGRTLAPKSLHKARKIFAQPLQAESPNNSLCADFPLPLACGRNRLALRS